uniref:Uncharacterized protein n=1 Tax=Rhizophora mucronata TaxID=61149 RepID=A0A2P2QX66_RHIMU
MNLGKQAWKPIYLVAIPYILKYVQLNLKFS